MLKHELIIIIIISGFGICGAAVVPDSGVGNTWQRLTLVLHEFLSNGLTPSRLHIVISFLTHADHVFLGLLRFLVPGTPNRVMELMQEVARCTFLVPPKTPSAKNSRDLVYIQFLVKHSRGNLIFQLCTKRLRDRKMLILGVNLLAVFLC